MSRVFTGNLANYLETVEDESALSLGDKTVLVYAKISALPGANSTIFWGGSDSSAASYATISIKDTNLIRVTNRSDATSELVTTETPALDTWMPMVMRLTLDSGEFLGSGPDWAKRATGTNTRPITSSGDNRLALGCNRDTSPSDPFTGKIAHFAVWDAKLSDTDIQSLLSGADPATIAVADRQLYWPLTDASLLDVWSGSDYELAVAGTVATDADNPTFGGSGPEVTISDAGDELYLDGETGIVITGANFEAAKGTGRVVISPSDDIDDAGAVEQTTTAWGDTSITFTAVRSALAFETGMYLFVENDSGDSNASGFSVQFDFTVSITETLYDRDGNAVASETDIKASVWRNREPTGAPDQEFTALSTDGSGELVTPLAKGSLSPGDPVYFMPFKDHASDWQAGIVKLVPDYS